MKTFEQYIIEAKQNYIFGGTDDRNTDIAEDRKIFKNLQPGDKIYIWRDTHEHNVEECTFKTARKETSLMHLYCANDRDVYVYCEDYYTGTCSFQRITVKQWFVTTSFGEMQEILKKYKHIEIDESSIIR